MTHLGVGAVLIAALGTTPAWAQTEGGKVPHAGHRQMPSNASPHAPVSSGMDHSTMDHGEMSATAPGTPDEGSASAQAMDHGDMKTQRGSPPADARDPFAYSGADAADLGPRQLHLSDQHRFGSMLVDRLERTRNDDGEYATSYDAQAWFGAQYDRLVIDAEGEYAQGQLQEARTELLWGHALTSYWDTQLGIRHDSGEGPNRSWLAIGVQGLAPYWFELDVTAYLGEQRRTALRIEAEYELLITQRLVLQPRAEVNLYGKSDEARGIGSGLSDLAAGLRLRYEISRQFAPYFGVEWRDTFGRTKNLREEAGEPGSESRWVAGVRFWF